MFDALSKTMYYGTDDDGMLLKSEKKDGSFHVMGNLSAAPTAVFKKALREARPLLDAA